MAMQTTARDVALDVLIAVEERGAYSNLMLNDFLKKSGLPLRDRGLTTELVYGTIQRKNTLDWILNRLVKNGISSLEPWVRHLLRMGVYQLHYLDRIPGRAAVHESVRMAKERGHKGISGLVNGVLRSYQRKSRQWRFTGSLEAPDQWALFFSHPEWMVQRLIEVYQPKVAKAILEANNRPPRVARSCESAQGRSRNGCPSDPGSVPSHSNPIVSPFSPGFGLIRRGKPGPGKIVSRGLVYGTG